MLEMKFKSMRFDFFKNPSFKIALSFVFTLAVFVFLWRKFNGFQNVDFQWATPQIFFMSVVLIWAQSALSALRMKLSFLIFDSSISFKKSFAVQFASLFYTQIFNFSGASDILKYVFLRSESQIIFRPLLADKMFTFLGAGLLMLFLKSPWVVVFALPFVFFQKGQRAILTLLCSALSFFFLVVCFEMIGKSFGLQQSKEVYANVLFFTAASPFSVFDWGTRELLSTHLMEGGDSSAQLSASLNYGLSMLLASLPGAVVVFFMKKRNGGTSSKI